MHPFTAEKLGDSVDLTTHLKLPADSLCPFEIYLHAI